MRSGVLSHTLQKKIGLITKLFVDQARQLISAFLMLEMQRLICYFLKAKTMHGYSIVLVVAIVFVSHLLHGSELAVIAQEQSKNQERSDTKKQADESKKQPPLVVTLEDVSTWPNFNTKKDADGFTWANSFDINKDGIVDLELRTQSGRGPLSTYYTSYRLVAVNGCRFLKGGKPLEKGTTLQPGDLFATTSLINLCNVGGSLRFPQKSYKEFSGGLWWNQSGKGLAVLLQSKNQIEYGFVPLDVSSKGKLTFGTSNFKKLEIQPIEF